VEPSIDRMPGLASGGRTISVGDPQWCLHRPDGFNLCYAPPVAVLVRVGDLLSTPVCAEHIEAGQAAIRGRTEVRPLDQWLAGPRGYRPGLAGS
jgi:hypothetical protein